MKRRALVVAPGRGTYNRAELGTLARLHGDKRDLLSMADAWRAEHGRPTLTDLDGAPRFEAAAHVRGDNASPLIFACAYADFLDIDRDAFDIVAVTGNSMGWYIALACARAVSAESGLAVVDTMGALMHEQGVGGQTVYPYVDAEWGALPGRRDELLALAEGHGVLLSIDLGGLLVFAGEDARLAVFEKQLPAEDRYPLRLPGHAAFHTPLLAHVAAAGRAALPAELFGAPALPLIDGRGHIWRPRETRAAELRDYTLGAQVTQTYDFARAIRTGLREFAPDAVIVLGPGATLSGSVAQALVGTGWRGMADKASFQARQAEGPFVLAMGIPEQRALTVSRQRRMTAR